MKVKELQIALNKLNPEMDVFCYSEDKELLQNNQLFRLLHIESVDISEGEMTRDNNRVPSLKLVKSKASTKLVTLNVTTTF